MLYLFYFLSENGCKVSKKNNKFQKKVKKSAKTSVFFDKNSCKVLKKSYICIPMKKIILITGGQRSGKSQYAEKLALSLSPQPIYLATAHIWDEEFRQRVKKHQERRGPQWINIEEERELSRLNISGRVTVIDCITLWCTNYFFDRHKPDWEQPSVDEALEAVKQEFDRFTTQDATFIFVTNEIGSGGVSTDATQRRFTDLEGWMNQYVASKADEVILMVSGIPVKIK